MGMLNKDIDGHAEEILKRKNERLPLLKNIEGIDKVVLDLGIIYSEHDRAEDSWARPS
jgi:hypothetical protein